MKFKNPKLMPQFFQLWPLLRIVLCEADHYCQRNFGKEIYATSLIRKGDKGVHGCRRGTDARCEYGRKPYLTKKEIGDILTYFNKRYIYDPKRPRLKVVIYHRVPGSTHHLHFQVHPNTVKRGKLS